MRDACDERGMKMYDFMDQLVRQALDDLKMGHTVIPRLNGFGGTVRKSVSKIK